MKNTITLALVALLAMTFGCSADTPKTEPPEAKGAAPTELKVSVLVDGGILLDGAKISLSALRERLKQVSGSNVVVWYYRAQGQSEPPKEAALVIQAIMDNQLPIALSSKPDFSTVVDEDGFVKPR